MIIKNTSSLEKIFLDDKIENIPELNSFSALKGERFSYQIAICADECINEFETCSISLESDISEYVQIRKVKSVPVEYPVYITRHDDNYSRTTPGLYPDLLLPMTYVSQDQKYGILKVVKNLLRSLWIDIKIPNDCKCGKHEIKITFTSDVCTKESIFTLDVIDAILPKQDLIYTEWFHLDALANYYRVDVFSEKHFEIIRNYVKTARENGINMLLVPVFTPPLDTEVGGERLTTQLVKVIKENDEYTYDYDLIDRYLDLLKEENIEYYEISHLFTQWGAHHAPKIMAYENGEYKKIFGWETDSQDPTYVKFLRSFLTSFISHMKLRSEDQKCYFHISDEPSEEHLESYMSCKKSIEDLLEGYHIMDALSNFEFYQRGIVKTPIPASDHIKPFLDAGIKDLWTYYCCGQCIGVSNRLIAMPSYRNRVIGMQMYKYDIKGFLQWGYNFYNNRFSHDKIEPYIELSGEYWVPAGDTFSVYPERTGHVYESLRIIVFNEGIQDMRALKLCEKYYSKEEILKEIESVYGEEISFDKCPYSSSKMLSIRETINKLIRDKI